MEKVIKTMVSDLAEKKGVEICQYIFGKAEPDLMKALAIHANFKELEGNQFLEVIFEEGVPEEPTAKIIPFPKKYREIDPETGNFFDPSERQNHQPENDEPEPPQPNAM